MARAAANATHASRDIGKNSAPLPHHKKHSPAQSFSLHSTGSNQAIQRALTQRRDHSRANPSDSCSLPHAVHEALRSSGRRLDDNIRLSMEARFRHDLSHVRIHDNAASAESAAQIHAAAYTSGSKIVFGHDQYAPNTIVGRQLLTHELAHVVQQSRDAGAAPATLAPTDDLAEHEARQVAKHSGEIERPVRRVAPGAIQRQLITPLGQGGGFGGLLEKGNQRLMGHDPDIHEPDPPIWTAIQHGWRSVRELTSTELLAATVNERMTMLGMLAQAWWTGGAEEEAIMRILKTTPESDAAELARRLATDKIEGESYLSVLDDVVNFGNNLELHSVLSELRLKAMGPQRAADAIRQAPVLPWHDVMGFFEDAATFDFEQTSRETIRVKYPVHQRASTMFADEISRLPTDLFVGGHEFALDDVLVIHDYDAGRFVPVVAQELIGYQNSGVRGFLGHVLTVASLATPVGAAKTVLGKAALFTLERVLPVTFLVIDENRINLVKAFPTWGPRMIYFSDIVKIGVGAFGLFRFATGGYRIFQDWKAVRDARKLMDPNVLDPNAERLALQLEGTVDDIYNQIDELKTAETQSEANALSQQKQPGGASAGGGSGTPYKSALPHVQQKAPDWCGAACGEMAVGRVGGSITQEELAASKYFSKPWVVDDQIVRAGGFQTGDLKEALQELSPIKGRKWVGGTLSDDISSPAKLRQHLNGYLKASGSSIILRVEGANHWIVIDAVTSEGLIAIRDPRLAVATRLTADELFARGPTGDLVLSAKPSK